MTIFDLVFLLSILGGFIVLMGIGVALIRHHYGWAKWGAIGFGSYLLIYTVLLISVALLSPQEVLHMGQQRCFDDWCIAAVQASKQESIATSPAFISAKGQFILVTVQVTSRAKGISQRALDVQTYLLDGQEHRYDLATTAQSVYDATAHNGPPLNSLIAPEGSFTHTLVFDVPQDAMQLALVVTHGQFPDLLIIGSDQSFLHRPTLIRLSL